MPYFIYPFFCQEIFRLFTELSGSLSYSYIYIFFLFLPRESKELCSLCPLRRVKLLIFTSVRAGHMTYRAEVKPLLKAGLSGGEEEKTV